MEEKLTKEMAQKLMAIKGEARGVTLRYDWDYILQQKGEEGLRKLESKMAELGFPLKYEEIEQVGFYPIGMDALSILAIKELFNFDEKKLEELGAWGVKFSFLEKLLVKYFASFPILLKGLPRMWQGHYTVGDLEVGEVNEEKKYVILRLKNFSLHATFCIILKGFFAKGFTMVRKIPATCEETKCIFRGDDYHEFILKW
jgi:hypothetical protein